MDAFDRTAVTRSRVDKEGDLLDAQRRQAEAQVLRTRWRIAAGVIALVCLAWWFRWDVQPFSNERAAYILDRVTGRLYYVNLEEATRINLLPDQR